jgi:trehalose synthase
MPYLGGARRLVFSRKDYVPQQLADTQLSIIPPTIDPFSAKNQDLSETAVRAILGYAGIVDVDAPDGDRTFSREDGSPGRVDRCAEIIQMGPTPRADTPLVVQVSRWDRLKDHLGVMRGFARVLSPNAPNQAECLLVGPDPRAVADDPEGVEVFEELLHHWRALPDPCQRRIHLVNLPMEDVEENGAIVNAIQRHATVVVQKSLREGFGLTLTEAMWKGRAVLASAIGGLQDQIVDGVSGILLKDPTDLATFSDQLGRLLQDGELRKRLGLAAEERVRAQFLGMHSLLRYAEVVAAVLD